MNLNEIKIVIAQMMKLREAQNRARQNLIKFLCGDEVTYKKFVNVIGDGFSMDILRWKHSLEYQNGDQWENVFAFNLSEDQSIEQIVEALFIMAKRKPAGIAKMLSEYDSRIIQEKTEAANFVANYNFADDHHEFIKLRINDKNAAVNEFSSEFAKVEAELRYIWHCILDYAILDYHRNWQTTNDFSNCLVSRYECMIKDLIPECVSKSKMYIKSLEWMDEYEEYKTAHPEVGIPTMTMEELEKHQDVEY